MIVRVLGSAAGGGVPQWNCACANCTAARAGRQPRRMESCAAVSADGERWLLLNCSPDIARQIESFAPLQPRERRGTPIAGMLFTDANVDHIGGLATLRQSGDHRFIVRSTQIVRDIGAAQPAFARFTAPPHCWLTMAPGEYCTPIDALDPAAVLRIRTIPVPGTTPGYAGRRIAEGAVVAFEISEGAATLLFAPVFSALDDGLRDALETADAALIDGTFYMDDELIAGGLMRKSARDLGHQPVGGASGTLAQLNAAHRGRIIFTHVNNSNPMLDPQSAAAESVRQSGCQVAFDGLELRL